MKRDFGAAPGLIKNREFAPDGMRDPADKYKVRFVQRGDSYEVVMVGTRPTVKKITEKERDDRKGL